MSPLSTRYTLDTHFADVSVDIPLVGNVDLVMFGKFTLLQYVQCNQHHIFHVDRGYTRLLSDKHDVWQIYFATVCTM